MTAQEKKDWLLRYADNEREIRRLEDELERWQSRAEQVTAIWSFAPGGDGDDRMQKSVDRIFELRGALYDRLTDSIELRCGIEAAIDALPDARHRLLMRYRYIDGLRWEEVAEKTNYSFRQATRIHAAALERVEMP